MAKTPHRIQRKVLSAVANQAFRYLDKDPKKNMLRMIHMIEKLAGSQFPQKTYTKLEEILRDDTNVWNRFFFKTLEEVDHDVIVKAGLALGLEAGIYGTKAVRANREKYKCNIPWVILMDPTSACNLKCKGCWSAEYGHRQNLSYEEMDNVVNQGVKLGTHFYMFTGGEPLVRKKDVIRLCEEHQDCAFLAYTNATLVDKAFADEMKRVGNLSLAISVEGSEQTTDGRRGDGVYAKAMEAMDLLKANKCLYGLSICYTRQNVEAVTSDEFIDKMIEKGCRFAWYFHYMPVGQGADTDMLLTPEQRDYVFHRIRELRSFEHGKPMFLVDFQNDGEYVGGCIAGGRNYFHINSAGDIEPCVFVHYSDSNIRTDTLLDALQKPLFRAYYKNQPFNDNMLRPCPMLENPNALRRMVNETGARSTDLMAPEDVETLCARCDQYSEAWAPSAKRVWEEQERFHPFTQYYRDTPEAQLEREAEKLKNKK